MELLDCRRRLLITICLYFHVSTKTIHMIYTHIYIYIYLYIYIYKHIQIYIYIYISICIYICIYEGTVLFGLVSPPLPTPLSPPALRTRPSHLHQNFELFAYLKFRRVEVWARTNHPPPQFRDLWHLSKITCRLISSVVARPMYNSVVRAMCRC